MADYSGVNKVLVGILVFLLIQRARGVPINQKVSNPEVTDEVKEVKKLSLSKVFTVMWRTGVTVPRYSCPTPLMYTWNNEIYTCRRGKNDLMKCKIKDQDHFEKITSSDLDLLEWSNLRPTPKEDL